MKHIGLFEGIGGFSLAARWMGWETVAWCEWNEFCQKILNHHFPNAKQHGDITKTDFNVYRGQCDILTGGFPCQPYSQAGKRLGKEDERHLWPEMLRAIREIQPRYVVGENVRGLTNWNGGLVFDEVQADLETQGYEVLPFLLPACAVNAPHRRDRIWFIAYASKINGKQVAANRERESSEQISEGGILRREPTPLIKNGIITNPQCIGQQGQGRTKRQIGTEANGNWKASWVDTVSRWPTQSPVRNGNDGIPADMDTTTFSKSEWNKESLKAAGNAIVPQIAYQIFKAIEQTA